MDSQQKSTRWLNVLLALTVFMSAWLVFQVQPMVAKRILPWFGGGTAVWTTTMLFFQLMLFAGYLYAHLASRRLSPRALAAVHAGLLAAAVAAVAATGLLPGERWKPEGSEQPIARIAAMLSACVGLPFFVLAATAPLVQLWFSRANQGRSPFRLYALSNVGSLAALLSYPALVEPRLGIAEQGLGWSVLFAGFAVLCAASAWLSLRAAAGQDAAAADPALAPEPIVAAPVESAPVESGRPRRLEHFLWLALPAIASVLLLAVTAYLCQDVAAIPLLWIAPMVVYLLTFILSFDSDFWYRRWFWLPAAAASSFASVYAWDNFQDLYLPHHLATHLALLLSIGMVCHGELARMRPRADRLTSYYLCISAGGALGGVLVGVVAPVLLADHYELQLSILAAWILALVILVTDRRSPFYDGGSFKALLAMGALLIALGVAMYRESSEYRGAVRASTRNFYGVLKVLTRDVKLPSHSRLVLANGRIWHGVQLVNYPRHATQYYRADSGVGLALLQPHETGPRRIGVVGLGTGTLAAYAEKGDLYRFYEINPSVTRFADSYFTFLRDARDRGAEIDVVPGDARLALERSPPQDFDVLAVDAFSGDAIPTHLLTLEAFAAYLRHLEAPHGVLAIHISNQYLDLSGVVESAARRYGLTARLVDVQPPDEPGASRSVWVLLSRPEGYLATLKIGTPLEASRQGEPEVVWTDEFSNLLTILRDASSP
jgi:hypothetical protein